MAHFHFVGFKNYSISAGSPVTRPRVEEGALVSESIIKTLPMPLTNNNSIIRTGISFVTLVLAVFRAVATAPEKTPTEKVKFSEL